MKLDNNNHSVFCLYYHLVLVVKYRRNVFTSEISTYAKEIFIRISKSYNIFLEEWNYDSDHVHIMFIWRSFLVHQAFTGFAEKLFKRYLNDV